jgi:DNA-binding transcriptional ArsR family regulator
MGIMRTAPPTVEPLAHWSIAVYALPSPSTDAEAASVPRPARSIHPEPDPFEALGDPQRRAILTLLGEGPHAVGELADALPISRPAVSFHLRLLKDAGLVDEARQGTRRIYRLREEGLGAVAGYLEQVWGDAATRFRILAENSRAER